MKEMSQLYARVFLQILDSSIAEDYTLRHVFEDLLKLADHKTGIVDMTRQAIARRLNLPESVLSDAINKLESADPNSRDADFDGRRIERLDQHRDWGWTILNWKKYAELKNKADVAARVQKHRNKENPVPPLKEFAPHLRTPRLLDKWAVWVDCRCAKSRCKNWEALFNEQIDWLSQYTEPQAVEIISASIRGNWQGLFPPKDLPPSPKSTGADTVILGKEYERVTARMATIRSTYGDHQSWSDGDKKEFNKLKIRRDELRTILKITI